MKRFSAILLSALLTVPSMLTVFPETAVYADELTHQCGENLFWELEDGGETLHISGTGKLDIYAGYYAPCNVSDPVYVPKGQGDMNDVMISFSEGYNEFITSLEEQYVGCLIRRRRATILLSRMLSIKLPYSRLMYLYYYKKQDPEEISESLYISRATFFRLKSAAITALTSLYYSSDDGDVHGENEESEEPDEPENDEQGA